MVDGLPRMNDAGFDWVRRVAVIGIWEGWGWCVMDGWEFGIMRTRGAGDWEGVGCNDFHAHSL